MKTALLQTRGFLRGGAFLLPVIVVMCAASVAPAANPVVSGVTFDQRTDGSRLVDVHYDVADADGDTLAVTLLVSDDDGATWDHPVIDVSGDVGIGVLPGSGRHIVWNAGVMPDLAVGDGYRVRVVASDLGVTFEPHSPRNVAITDFGAVDWSDPANIEHFSRADLLLLMGAHLWSGGIYGDEPVIARMKALNPDLVVLAYVSSKSAKLYAASGSPDFFWKRWYDRTLPYWTYSTAGDTVSDFPGNVVVNVLEENCRDAMISTIVEFQTTSLNQFDGVYWDYFNTRLWISPDVGLVGEADLDGDGVGHDSDPDEMAAFRASQVDLIGDLRSALGEDFIQFFNGQRAYVDSTFAALGDGAFYELFPTLFFPHPDMKNALDPAFEYNLFRARGWYRTANGGPFVVLANTVKNTYVDAEGVRQELVLGNMFRAVALVADLYASWHRNDDGTYSNTYSWTDNDITLGAPLAPPTFTENFIERDFEYGRVVIEMIRGYYPNPFAYQVYCRGALVEELRIPYRYP